MREVLGRDGRWKNSFLLELPMSCGERPQFNLDDGLLRAAKIAAARAGKREYQYSRRAFAPI